MLLLSVLLILAEKSVGEMTLNQALMIAVGTLAGVVVVLFAYLRSVDARQQKRLEECEEDRRALWQAIIELGGHPPRMKRA